MSVVRPGVRAEGGCMRIGTLPQPFWHSLLTSAYAQEKPSARALSRTSNKYDIHYRYDIYDMYDTYQKAVRWGPLFWRCF